MEKIFHIPHSSTYIPEEYLNEYTISKSQLKRDALLLCDNRTNEMINDINDSIMFNYSRLFCDVERYNSDIEEMNDIGMGILYTVNHNLEIIRKTPSQDIIKFYDEHHKKLNNLTKQKLLKNDEVLFIDLHSYSKEPLKYEKNKKDNRPDICIGINNRYNKNIVDKLIYTIKKFGYSYDINKPFKGCLLPSDYINNENVHGVMIEIRKDIYDTSEKFEKIKNLLKCVTKF